MHKDPIDSLFPGANQIRLPSCHSTNVIASDLLAEGDIAEGTVIITDHQTKGKGQRGNSWESEPGKNLTCSLILKPKFLPVKKQFELIVVSSLAIVQTLKDLGLSDAQVKWPNDIYYGDAKIAGILIENSVRANHLEYSVVGIGLNINQQNFKTNKATSIGLELKKELSVKEVLDQLLIRITAYYTVLKLERSHQLRAEYVSKLRGYNLLRSYQDLKNNQTIKGKITGVNGIGQLLLRVEENDLSFNFKEVSFLE